MQSYLELAFCHVFRRARRQLRLPVRAAGFCLQLAASCSPASSRSPARPLSCGLAVRLPSARLLVGEDDGVTAAVALLVLACARLLPSLAVSSHRRSHRLCSTSVYQITPCARLAGPRLAGARLVRTGHRFDRAGPRITGARGHDGSAWPGAELASAAGAAELPRASANRASPRGVGAADLAALARSAGRGAPARCPRWSMHLPPALERSHAATDEARGSQLPCLRRRRARLPPCRCSLGLAAPAPCVTAHQGRPPPRLPLQRRPTSPPLA